MSTRWRVMIVIVPEGTRGLSMASSELQSVPPRDPAVMAAQLLHLGAEVKLVDQAVEQLSSRVVAREARWWHADLVLFHAGGGHLANDPVPDQRPLRSLLKGDWPAVPLLLTGPLGWRYADALLAEFPVLSGVHHGSLGPWLVGGYDLETAPGLQLPDGQRHPPFRGRPLEHPAWHLLPLEAYPGRGSTAARAMAIGDRGPELERTIDEVRHAVQRGGAGFVAFEARDLGARRALAIELAHRMFGAAPGVPWSCRVRADHMDPALALALAQGACEEVLIVPQASLEAPALPPMDDPDRESLEAALEAVRVTGMTAVAEHVVGRPGHRPSSLDGWQRWFAVRGVSVRPSVRVLHAGDRGPGEPGLAEARARAGCWDNELSPRDVERAVRRLGGGADVPVGLAS